MTGGSKAATGGALALVVLLPVLLVVLFAGASDEACTPKGASGMGIEGPTGVTLEGMGESQLAIARDIVAIGKQRGVPENVIISELMAAAQESGFRNYANSSVPESMGFPHDAVGADHDSVGPHQIRAYLHGESVGGIGNLMNPTVQINWYLDHALQVPGYETMDPGDLAQAVEGSLYPGAYAKHAPLARQLYDTFRGVELASMPARGGGPGSGSRCTPGGGPMFTPGGPFGQNVIAAAMRWVDNTAYAWGGGTKDGPSQGISDGGGAGDAHGDTGKVGFDCSGLTLYAVYHASGGRIELPHYTGDRANPGQLYDPRGQEIPFDQRQPGDLIFFGSGGSSHHVGIFYGRDAQGQDLLLNAPSSGQMVSIMPLSGWAGEEMYVRRFG